MSDIIQKKCERCGTLVEEKVELLLHSHPYLLGDFKDIQSAYVCQDCYASNWDAGFSASTEYTDEMHIKECNEEKFRKALIDPKDMVAIMSMYGLGIWHCVNCTKERFDYRRLEGTRPSVEELAKELLRPCPSCHLKGHLEYNI